MVAEFCDYWQRWFLVSPGRDYFFGPYVTQEQAEAASNAR